jgi:DNA-binding NtrC family response regulator
MPALRDHLEDIPDLIRHFYEGRGERPPTIEGPNLQRLLHHAWPGNVRELRNVLERAWALSGEGGRDFAALDLWLQPGGPTMAADPVDTHLSFKDAKERCVEQFERRYLAAIYSRFDRNITRAAEHAGINRRHFRELLEKHGIYDPR